VLLYARGARTDLEQRRRFRILPRYEDEWGPRWRPAILATIASSSRRAYIRYSQIANIE
jgi:hypothetical protein